MARYCISRLLQFVQMLSEVVVVGLRDFLIFIN